MIGQGDDCFVSQRLWAFYNSVGITCEREWRGEQIGKMLEKWKAGLPGQELGLKLGSQFGVWTTNME